MSIFTCLKQYAMKLLMKLKIIRRRKRNIVILGLDDSGKTTFIHRIEDNIFQVGTAKFYQRKVPFKLQNTDLIVEEHDSIDRAMRLYYVQQYISGIIYIIDSSNPSRFEDGKGQLNHIQQIKELSKIPILILGNKIDKLNAVSESYLRQNLGLFEKGTIQWNPNQKQRPIQLFMCTLGRRIGYIQGLKWLNKMMI